MVDSAAKCPQLYWQAKRQYCENQMVLTYNSDDKVLGGRHLRRLFEEHCPWTKAFLCCVLPNGLDPAGALRRGFGGGHTTYSRCGY